VYRAFLRAFAGLASSCPTQLAAACVVAQVKTEFSATRQFMLAEFLARMAETLTTLC
jgi:hypothetical protein